MITSLLLSLQCQQVAVPGKLEYAFQPSQAKINPLLKGTWKSIGGGYIWDATGDSIRLYSYTENFCFKEQNDYLEGLMNSEAQFRLKQDTLQVFLTDYGASTQKLNTPWLFIREDEVLETCMDRETLQKSNPKVIWTIFLENLQENYAFPQERKMDWGLINHTYQDRITASTSHDSLFQWMGEVVLQTQDHHTKIFNKTGQKIQYTRVPSADTVYGAFLNQEEIKDLNEYYGRFFASNYENITDTLLRGEGTKSANGQLEWGMLNERIGYLHVHSFAGFVKTPQPRMRQIDSLQLAMTEAIHALQESESIIVDVSFNFGGFDAAALTVAGFFAERKVLAYTAQVFFEGDYVNSGPVYVFPSSSTPYTKPIYLLTSDISRSAAEGFTMMMKALPQVTHVGTPHFGHTLRHAQ